jgi:hypothetical protein
MYTEYEDDASTTREQHSASRLTDSFWYQDFSVNTLKSSRMHDGMLFYHGMGTGKTCLYTKYLASVLQQGRRYTNITIVTKRVLRDSVIEAFKMPSCNQGVNILGKRNRGVTFQTYYEFIGRKHVHGTNAMRAVVPNSVQMSLVVVDEAHKILEKSKTTSIKGGDVMFRRFMEMSRTNPSATFLLFTGTPFNTHEVDIVNLTRVACRAFNEFLRKFFAVAIEGDFKITPNEFTQAMNNADNSRQIMEQLGKAISYIQLPQTNDIPPRIMCESADATFAVRTDTKTLTHQDLHSFGPFYISCMTKAHQAKYESLIRPSSGMERNVVRMVDTCSLSCPKQSDAALPTKPTASLEHGRVFTYDLRGNHDREVAFDAGEMDVSYAKRLFTYENEFIHLASNNGVPIFLQSLRAHTTFPKKLAYLKQFCPIMGAVVEHLFETKAPYGHRKEMCMIYSHYAHMLDVRSDQGNTLKGIVPFILSAFGFGTHDPDNTEKYTSFLFLHKRASYNKLKVINSHDNWDGSLVRVLLVSPKFSEGISISNLQQIHILAPDYGLFSKTDQAISRGFRSKGHVKVNEMLGTSFKGVRVFMHLCLSPSRQFPARLYYYLRMMYMDVRIKAFERYCMTFAYDCSFMQRINRHSIAEHFTRTCQYMLCDYTCERKKPNVLIDDSAYYPSLYEHYRPFVKTIEGDIARSMHRGIVFSISGELERHLTNITNYGLPVHIAESIYRDTVAQFANRKSIILSVHGEYVFPVWQDDNLVPFPARLAFLQRDAVTCLQNATRSPTWYTPLIEPLSAILDAPKQLRVVNAPSESQVVLKPRKPKSERFVFTEISADCLAKDIQFFDDHRRCLRKCFDEGSYWYLLKSIVHDDHGISSTYKEKSFRELLKGQTKAFPSKLHSEPNRIFINGSLALCFKYLRRDVLEVRHGLDQSNMALSPPQRERAPHSLRGDVVAKAMEHCDRYTDHISLHQGFRSMAYILLIHVGDAEVRRHLFYKVFAHFWYLGFQTNYTEARFIEISKTVVSQFLHNPKLRQPPTPLLHLLHSLLDDFFHTPGNEGMDELACGTVLLESSVGTNVDRLGTKDKPAQCIVRILRHINRFFLVKYVEMVDAHLLPACLAILSQSDKFAWVKSDPMPTVKFIDDEVERYVNGRQPREALFRNLFFDSYVLLRVLPGTIFKVGKDLLDNSTRIKAIYAELNVPKNTARTLVALERVATARGFFISTEHNPYNQLPQVSWASEVDQKCQVTVVSDTVSDTVGDDGDAFLDDLFDELVAENKSAKVVGGSDTHDGDAQHAGDSAFSDDLFDKLLAENQSATVVGRVYPKPNIMSDESESDDASSDESDYESDDSSLHSNV